MPPIPPAATLAPIMATIERGLVQYEVWGAEYIADMKCSPSIHHYWETMDDTNRVQITSNLGIQATMPTSALGPIIQNGLSRHWSSTSRLTTGASGIQHVGQRRCRWILIGSLFLPPSLDRHSLVESVRDPR